MGTGEVFGLRAPTNTGASEIRAWTLCRTRFRHIWLINEFWGRNWSCFKPSDHSMSLCDRQNSCIAPASTYRSRVHVTGSRCPSQDTWRYGNCQNRTQLQISLLLRPDINFCWLYRYRFCRTAVGSRLYAVLLSGHGLPEKRFT